MFLISLSMLDIKSSRTKAALAKKRFVTAEVPWKAASFVRQLRRIVRHQMFFQNQRHDQQRRGQEGSHRAPQPGPERQRDEDGERVQREPSADDGRGDEMAF